MAVKRILISEAEEGMELAGDVYDTKGRLIAPFGTVLDKEVIRKLENYDIVVLKIIVKSDIDDIFMESSAYERSEEAGYFEKIKQSEDFKTFRYSFEESVDELSNKLNEVVYKNEEIDINGLLESVKKVINSNSSRYNLMDILSCMRGYDDLTFAHSMSVSLICNVFAGWLGYGAKDVELLTAAGLLHDIGKIKIPKEIITKPSRLTDEEYRIIKMHPVLGYEILKRQPVDNRIRNAALMHHEKCDGSGYPQGLKRNQIDDVAKIVAIADVYDAMTANRVYREGMSPFDVIEYFEMCIDIFEPGYLMIFLQKIALLYVGSTVLLTDGTEGKIIMINSNSLGRPVVLSANNKAIDLSRDKSIKIAKLI